MDKEERRFFERMSTALEEMTKALEQISRAQKRVADVMEKQQPSKANQVLTTVGALAAVSGFFSIVDMVINWFKGG